MIRSVFREIQRVYGTEKVARAGQPAPAREAAAPRTRRFDSLALSQAAGRYQQALRAAQAAPAERDARIAEAQKELASGTYTMRAGQIASMLLRRGDVE